MFNRTLFIRTKTQSVTKCGSKRGLRPYEVVSNRNDFRSNYWSTIIVIYRCIMNKNCVSFCVPSCHVVVLTRFTFLPETLLTKAILKSNLRDWWSNGLGVCSSDGSSASTTTTTQKRKKEGKKEICLGKTVSCFCRRKSISADVNLQLQRCMFAVTNVCRSSFRTATFTATDTSWLISVFLLVLLFFRFNFLLSYRLSRTPDLETS